jgi:gluconolactonase
MHSFMHRSFLLYFLFLVTPTDAQPETDRHSVDFTAENIFSANIEGPAFDSSGNLYAVNFQKDGTIGKVSADGRCELFVTLPEGSVANSIQFTSRGTMLLADFPMHNILAVDMATKKVSIFCHNDLFNQPNDICINKQDQIFASDPQWATNSGKLWRINPDGTAALLEDSMGTTNGICLSPDEQTLYVNESVQRNVWKYTVSSSGNISNKTLVIRFTDFGMDGMKCDRDGNLYITRYGKGTIAKVSPEGVLLSEIYLKGKNCSNLAFGGADGSTVFVTLQDRKGMEKFHVNIPGKGY